MPIQRQSYTVPYQSTANLIPINCQSDFNSVPIRFQSNQINPRLPTSHHSGTNPLTIQSVQCQSASPEPIHQSNVNSVPICQSITSLPIQDKSANPSVICQSITYIQSMPIHGKLRSSMPIQPITNPPKQYLTNPPTFQQSMAIQPVHHQ